MQLPLPYFREAGAGEGVVCTHANASTSTQWRPLMERLSPTFRIFAPDSLGAGRSPAWPDDRVVTLRDEVALLEPVFALAGRPLCLVGHSYGAAITLVAALTHPGMVRAMALYEPTLFSLLEEEAPGQAATHGIRDAAADAARAIDAGDPSAAGARFIDYWMGTGTWNAMPEARRDVVAASMSNIRGWAHALFNEPTPLRAFGALTLPILLMVGGKSPPSSRGVTRVLAGALPNASVVEFPELGHMGPITHPDVVNDAVARFIQGD